MKKITISFGFFGHCNSMYSRAELRNYATLNYTGALLCSFHDYPPRFIILRILDLNMSPMEPGRFEKC